METSASRLALWVRANVPQGSGPLSHLKLQKLCFYAYGAALAFDVEQEIGEVAFEAWRHGPVCREILDEYRHFRDGEIPAPSERIPYSEATQAPLRDALAVYSWLDAWALRQQSHREDPWQRAADLGGKQRIDAEALRAHFKRKFREEVRLPTQLERSWSFAVDGIPSARFATLRELADAIRRQQG